MGGPLSSPGTGSTGWYTRFPPTVNHWPLFFIWRTGLSFIIEIVIVGTVLGMRYIVTNCILLALVFIELLVFLAEGSLN